MLLCLHLAHVLVVRSTKHSVRSARSGCGAALAVTEDDTADGIHELTGGWSSNGADDARALAVVCQRLCQRLYALHAAGHALSCERDGCCSDVKRASNNKVAILGTKRRYDEDDEKEFVAQLAAADSANERPHRAQHDERYLIIVGGSCNIAGAECNDDRRGGQRAEG